MANSDDMIRINATLDIPAAAIRAVVENARQLAGKTDKGAYQVDTYEKLGEMISRFLDEKDFLGYVQDIGNFR